MSDKITVEKLEKLKVSSDTPADKVIDDDEEDDEEIDNQTDAAAGVDGDATAAKKKKKRKPKKKKKKATSQSSPPRVLVSQLYPNETYPSGVEEPYINDNAYRTTSEEKRAAERLEYEDWIKEYRQGATVHKQVRAWLKDFIKPGLSLTEICEGVEDATRHLTGHMGLEPGDNIRGGVGFPTGVNLNHIAAHYSPNAGNTTILQSGDVMKVDFGVHINGRIVDSAFTWTDDPKFDNLLAASREGMYTGVKMAGIDARVGEIGTAIEEVVQSYEIELDGKTIPIKPIRNLTGHNIGQWVIHGGKSLPIVKSKDQTKMEEGEAWACEVFCSTGKGYVNNGLETSHYAKRADAPKNHHNITLASARNLLSLINKNFGTIPFCRRYLDRLSAEKYLLGLNSLVKHEIVEDYPPLLDEKGSYTAQFEHCFLLKPTSKEILTKADDY